jgi:hypothetical protein
MRALMLVPVLGGNRVKVSAARCNISIRNPNCWFHFGDFIIINTLFIHFHLFS